jgi:hypothetical protein
MLTVETAAGFVIAFVTGGEWWLPADVSSRASDAIVGLVVDFTAFKPLS